MSARRAGRGVRVVLLALLATFGAACGVTTQDDPDALPRDEIPFGLLDPAPTTSTTSTGQTTTTLDREPELFSVYFLLSGRIHAVTREVLGEATLTARLQQLFDGPLPEERDLGLRTAIPPLETAITVDRDATTAGMELSAEFDVLEQDAAIGALAQIVYTLTAAPSVSRVRFLRDGEPIEVLHADGTSSSSVVTRADYPWGSVDVQP